ncbi:uncharacterized protein LOC117342643 [Pecten maximus]|uniref:uncharacterized protein LOC117342643 n=1 Tax=Pecten maximus TaxID=6579 RepID=UPI00145863E0|nr:uncharacterized protein LOC117342643 [Pecten maximus]
MMDLWLDNADDQLQPHVYRGQDNTKCNNTYLTPTVTEPIYAEIGNRATFQPEVNTQSLLSCSSSSYNAYITPVHQSSDERNGSTDSNTCTLLRKFLISVFFNIAFLSVLTSSLYHYFNCCDKDGSPKHQPSEIRVVDWKRSDICFLNQSMRCTAGSLRKSTHIQIINDEHFSPETQFQNRVPSLCCYDKSQSLQRLTHLLMLVKAHNEVKKVCRNCSTQHLIRTSDISIACRMEISEEELQLKDEHRYANSCKGGVVVRKTRMHALYFFLAINCSIFGNDVIKAGIRFDNQTIAQTEMQCDISLGVVTLSLFSFRNLTNGSKLIPFVSDTKCVDNDTPSNRFEILAL